MKYKVTDTTSNFNHALAWAESKAISDLDSKWCVTTKHGVYCACPLDYALEKDYHIICITVY